MAVLFSMMNWIKIKYALTCLTPSFGRKNRHLYRWHLFLPRVPSQEGECKRRLIGLKRIDLEIKKDPLQLQRVFCLVRPKGLEPPVTGTGIQCLIH